MNCTRCGGTGFLNTQDIPGIDGMRTEEVQMWIDEHPDTDAQVCDCCGNGEYWYADPGIHEKRDGEWLGGVPECI